MGTRFFRHQHIHRQFAMVASGARGNLGGAMRSEGPRTTADFAAVFRHAAIVLAACTTLVAGSSATARSEPPSPVATPAGTVNVTGDVRRPTTLTLDALRAFPAQTQMVTFQSSKGPQRHTYVGPALVDIVAAADPAVDSSDEHSLLSVVVVGTGADDYTAAVSWGEISPEFAATPVLVAHTEDGRELDQPRLVVPGDIKGGRYVSDLVELRVVNLRS
jgi:DMSO/TMAO reductase YedYZ molybdopterin-dependent catalytic subunit